jgi:fucose permease
VAADLTAVRTRALPLAPLIGCFGIFVTMGLLISTLGPLLPAIRGEFNLGPQAASTLVSAVPLGCVAGTLLILFLNRRFRARVLLAAAALTLAVGLAGTALAPALWLLYVSVVVTGIGYGASTALVNGVIAVAYGAKSAGLLNLLNGIFGVAAVVGPFLVAFLTTRLAYLPYVLVAVASAVLVARLPAAFRTIPEGAAAPEPLAVPPKGTLEGQQRSRSYGRLALVAAMLGTYVATEVAASSFATTHLLATGVDNGTAVRATSLFYVGLAGGRLLVVPIAARIGAGRLVLGCAALASVLLLVTWLAPLGGFTYLLVGAAMGPVFPTALAWLGEQGLGSDAMPIVLTAANVGGLVLPPIIGTLIGAVGATAAPLPMAVSVGLSAVLIGYLVRTSQGRRTS